MAKGSGSGIQTCVKYAAVVPVALVIRGMTPKALLGSRINFLPTFLPELNQQTILCVLRTRAG